MRDFGAPHEKLVPGVRTARGGRATHHNASMQVYADGARTRFVWVTDVLPDEIAPAISALVEAGVAAIRSKLERAQ